MAKASLGQQELEVLSFISDREPVSVREVADSFARSQGLARTTILTVMDRLRAKGYLSRKKSGGLFVYKTCQKKSQVLRHQVKDFVEKNLGGYVSPFLAYLNDERVMLDQDEIAELKRLIARYERDDNKGVEK
ncbi:MAG: BlaI/MecI/CopY family transcriptional regulator [Bdellovibrionales bacterium]|nr:BlaI/MecI/CopY family transcriptional regulator [Bdellovibrionales bacterium]